MAFVAKYRGQCDECGERIMPGQSVQYRADDLVHEVCDEVGEISEIDRDARREVCGACWLLKPCDCEEE